MAVGRIGIGSVAVIRSVQRHHNHSKMAKWSPRVERGMQAKLSIADALVHQEAMRNQVAEAVEFNRLTPSHSGMLLLCNRGMFLRECDKPHWVELEPSTGILKVWERPDCDGPAFGLGRSLGTWLAALSDAVWGSHCKEFSLAELEKVDYNSAWRNTWLHFKGGKVLLFTAENDIDFCKWTSLFDRYKVPAMDDDDVAR